MKTWTLYMHVSPSEKVYVGITSNINRRWAAHGYYYCLSDTIFSRAIKKYGWDNFQHIVIKEGLTKQEACSLEIQLIAFYKALGLSYNTTNGGEGTSGKQTEEHIRKRVASKIANSDTDYIVVDKNFNYIVCSTQCEAALYLNATQNNIAHVLHRPVGYTCRGHYLFKHTKGTPVNIDEIKKRITSALQLRHNKLSENIKTNLDRLIKLSKLERSTLTEKERLQRFGHKGNVGKHRSETTKRKISLKHKGKVIPEYVREAQSKRMSKPVEAFIDGNWIYFKSIQDAANSLNIDTGSISAVCLGKRKTVKHLKFRYYVARGDE